ncbi:MAG TPA: ABC transporter permease [Reyranella sp.]|nr:ABC transporter permease [Reyranella sp.]
MTALLRRPEMAIAALIFVVCFGGWELIIWLLDVPPIVLPAPSDIVESMIDMLGTASFAWHLGVTLYEILVGFAVGAFAGLFFGCLIGRFPLLEKSLYPYLVAFQTVPKVALAPLVVIWFGFGVGSKIVITAIISFFPILANTIAGLRATPADQIELLLAFTATRWQIFWKVQMPQALPYIMVGVDVALMMAVIGAIVGEFVSAKAGLGFLMLQKNFSMDMAGVFAILIVLSAIGVILHLAVQALRRHFIFWLDTQKSHSLETSAQ